MKIKNKKLKAYITLVVVILLVPFLLLQGINLVNTSIDIVHVSTSSIFNNKKYIYEQTCWEEVLYFLRNNDELIGEQVIQTPDLECNFTIEEIQEEKFKIILETLKEDYYSTTTKFVSYDQENLQYIPSL